MLIWLLSLTALATAMLSGVFGMAGGMLLMGAYTALLPVASAMVLHGATQLVANAGRAVILWRAIYVRGFCYYVAGALLAFALLSRVRYVPDPLVVFLGLGLVPFVAAALPARALDFERPGAAFLCGVQVASVQMLAGAAGPLLDVAFVRTRLSRTQVVATKSITQVFSHALKLVYSRRSGCRASCRRRCYSRFSPPPSPARSRARACSSGSAIRRSGAGAGTSCTRSACCTWARRAWRCCERRRQPTASSSTSKISVAFGGIAPGKPRSPYARWGGIVSLRSPPIFMPATPGSQPWIT